VRAAVVALVGALLLAPAAAQAAGGAATAPTRTARFGKQKFGYRSIGSGRPVVFVMGLSGTIDGWPPSFLDKIAASGHRVLIFDNEGVGRSTLRPGALTIRRMGQDTARFINALRLRRPDVVGWSMGGMIAQSLAVEYPKRLRRLVLMATAPGDGKATLPDAAALTALSSGDAAALLPDLFPPDQIEARDRYIADLLMRFDLKPIAPPAIAIQIRRVRDFEAIAQWKMWIATRLARKQTAPARATSRQSCCSARQVRTLNMSFRCCCGRFYQTGC